MAALREIFARFGVQFDSGPLQRGNRAVRGTTNSLRDMGRMVAGSLVVRGFRNFISSTLTMADDLDKVSQQIGLTIAQFQGLSHAANLAGVEQGAFANALGQLQRRANDAATGSTEAAESFQQLGVDVRGADGEIRPVAELFEMVGESLHNMENSSVRTALSMELMGRSGRRLLPMFSEGAEGIRQAAGELDTFGGGISQEFREAAVGAVDNLARLKLSFRSLRGTLVLAILPTVERVIGVLTRTNVALSRMPRTVRLLTGAFTALGVVATAVALKGAAAWLLAGWPILLAAAAVATLYFISQDLWNSWEHGSGITQQLVNEFGRGRTEGENFTSMLNAMDREVVRISFGLGMIVSTLEAMAQQFRNVANEIATLARHLMPVVNTLDAMGISQFTSTGRPIGSVARAASEAGPAFRERQKAIRAGGASGRSDPRFLQRALSFGEGMLPSRLRGRLTDRTPRSAEIAARSDVTISIQGAGMTPDEVARAARREVEKAQGRLAERVQAAAVPAGSS